MYALSGTQGRFFRVNVFYDNKVLNFERGNVCEGPIKMS